MRRIFYGLVALVVLSGCGGGGSDAPVGPVVPIPGPEPVVPPTYRATGRAASGDVFVHLFEWRWADIARECEAFLGPKGYRGVQISPPSEHAVIQSGLAFYPWWQRYQTVSYRLEQSRSGTAAELADMTARCRAVGVRIYADVVINHMTAGSGTGSAGSVYTKYGYPQVPYTSVDFHSPCGINNYNDAAQVQGCELVGLSDLRTESESVRERIAQYLIALHALGIAGYRVDAAKHMDARDLEAIMTKVNAAAVTAGRARPYLFLELSNTSGEGVTALQYYGVGFASGGAVDITDFRYADRLTDAFSGRSGGTAVQALTLPADALPSDKSVSFVDNHDTQRGSAAYYAGPGYELAIIFLLANPHGYPGVMSSFGFDRTTGIGRDAGPPAAGAGITASSFAPDGTSRCTAQLGLVQEGQWICEHRRLAISNMVAFRRATVGAPMTVCGRPNATIDGDANRIAICRDGAGFVAINRTDVATSAVLPTRLPAGTYCNVARFSFTPAAAGAAASCTGPAITVGGTGDATVDLVPQGAMALHVGAKLT